MTEACIRLRSEPPPLPWLPRRGRSHTRESAAAGVDPVREMLGLSLERGIRYGCRQFPIEESYAYVQGLEDLVGPSHPRFSAGGGHPSFGVCPEGTTPGGEMDADGMELRNEPTPEANRYGVGSASRLKLRE